MIVVDSSVWIEWLRSGSGEIDDRTWHGIDPTQILVGDIVLLEVLRGSRNDAQADAIERRMRRFAVVEMLDRRLVSKAARNYRLLRDRGITIRKLPDLIIGTFCIENGHRLLHRDRDFRAMSDHLGLRIA